MAENATELEPVDKKAEDKRSGMALRAKSRTWINNHFDELMSEIRELLKTGGKEDGPRVTLACKFLDKMLPNQNEGNTDGNGPSRVVFQIGNVTRGGVAVEVKEQQPAIDVESKQVE